MSFSIKKGKARLFAEIFKNVVWSLSVLKGFGTRIYIYIAFLIIQSVYQIYMTSRVGNIVDLALEDKVERLVVTGGYLVALYAVNIVITIAGNRFANRNYNGMFNELELIVYRKIMDSSWEDLTEYHSGDLITRLSSDIKTVAGNTSGLVPTIVARMTLIIGAGLYIVYIDYSMIFLALVIAPIVLVASRIFMGKIYESEARLREIESLINSYNVDTFNNIQAVKAFGLGDYFYDRMTDVETERRNVDQKTNKYIMCSYATSYFAGIIGASILIAWMFFRVHSGHVSFGHLSVIAFLALQIGRATENLLDLIPTIMAFLASADRVKKILSIPDEKDNAVSEDIRKLTENYHDRGIAIHIDDMFFEYKNGYSVFEGASLEAYPGETIAIVGPSGEGKTTMLRIIIGIVTSYRGRAYASDGSMEVNLGIKTRSIISYVPQGNTIMTGSILENLKIVNQDASDDEIREAMETAYIYDFVKNLPEGVNQRLGEKGVGLSEGQNQRLAIARALLKDTPVLLMDEATSALDVVTERKIIDNIARKYPRKTIIITTHRPTLLAMCDRVYRIADKKTEVIGQQDIQKLIDEF